jgi:hypothetical protein
LRRCCARWHRGDRLQAGYLYCPTPDGATPLGIVVILADAFGWRLRNTRALADAYTRRVPCVVYVPDVMDGIYLFRFYLLVAIYESLLRICFQSFCCLLHPHHYHSPISLTLITPTKLPQHFFTLNFTIRVTGFTRHVKEIERQIGVSSGYGWYQRWANTF